jgi:short-subunit dehydrogenase
VRVAVVTGGSSGIGAALARKLAARSFRCILVARGAERLQRVAAEIGAEAEVCDVASREDVDALARRIGERHRAVHLLVNNAGVPGRRGFLALEPERIEEVVRINYLGGVWCVRALLPLLEAGAPSHVVNVASVAGTVAGGPSGPYTASKFAQVAFSRCVAGELAPRGISVHTVNPGFTQTEGFPQDDLLARPGLRRLVIEPERVADAILAAVALDRPESFVPAGFRLVATLASLAPSTFTRVASRQRIRRP